MKPPLTKFSTEVFYPTGFLFHIYGFDSIIEFEKYAKSLGDFVVAKRTITHKGSQLPVYAIIPKGKSQKHSKNFSDFAIDATNEEFRKNVEEIFEFLGKKFDEHEYLAKLIMLSMPTSKQYN